MLSRAQSGRVMERGRVQHAGVIRFAIDPSYMPFNGLGSQGDFYGIDVEIAQEMARRTGLRAEFIIAGQDSLYDVLEVGQPDATISALIINPIIDYVWDYSTPYFDARQLVGQTCRVFSASRDRGWSSAPRGMQAARRLARRQAGIDVRALPTAREALQAVSDGQVDDYGHHRCRQRVATCP